MGNSFYTYEELKELHFAKLGKNVLISRKTSLYGMERMEIGDNVRIDDFALLSGRIVIGNHVHIAAYAGLFAGDAGIILDDFSGISSRCVIYAQSDDYLGYALTNPTIPDKYRKIQSGQVIVGRHVVVGTGSTILPGVTLGEGASVGAMTLVNKDAESFSIYIGIPMRKRADRDRKLLELEAELTAEENEQNS